MMVFIAKQNPGGKPRRQTNPHQEQEVPKNKKKMPE
jgi:hypothetical protein